MQAKQILQYYNQIEYLSTTDKKWYKLSDYYPFVFPLEESPEVVVLDTGGKGGDFGHFKVIDNKLIRQDIASREWIVVTDVRGIEDTPKESNRNQGITAVGEPFIITKELA